MDRSKIAELAQKMETKEDLLNLLNLIKKDEMEQQGFGDKYHPFTIRHIHYYCNPNHSFHRYRQFSIKKKTGGTRQITAPRNRSFMLLLDYLNEIFKSLYTPSKYAMGFTEGRSVVSNADVHKNKNYIYNIDLKDFFPSIEQSRIWKRLQLKPFNFPIPVANVIAGLCSMKEMRTLEDGTAKAFYVLPQGAPTSPIITNMICDKLDHRLAGLAKRFGLSYTRYADDITFSSMHNVYQNNSDFRNELARIITDQGFQMNDKKTRLQKKGSRQEVTGIIISEKLNVTQKYVRNLRNILYIWDRYGYATAYAKFTNLYKAEKGHVKKGIPDMINVLGGKLLYLKMVKGEADSVYTRLYKKYLELTDIALNPNNTTKQNVTYLETLPLLDFEKRNHTVVTICTSKQAVETETNPETGELIKEHTQPGRYAIFKVEKQTKKAYIKKSIKPEEEQDKENLAISACRDSSNTPFWLIHKKDKVIVPEQRPIDIDELNNELDSLLNT